VNPADWAETVGQHDAGVTRRFRGAHRLLLHLLEAWPAIEPVRSDNTWGGVTYVWTDQSVEPTSDMPRDEPGGGRHHRGVGGHHREMAHGPDTGRLMVAIQELSWTEISGEELTAETNALVERARHASLEIAHCIERIKLSVA
jgi:hypothetical protein